ncbi:SRPBCC family protein [Planomonospora alba]|uniref:SRPBCC family protein n=1 Tax=Planomonospora alba TaxID=161354 RepID=A0ABP6MRV9_9ACTN
MTKVDVYAASTGTPAAVWAHLADVRCWPRWSPFDSASLDVPGTGSENGVGAVRRYRLGARTTIERVVLFEPPVRLAYELVSGIQARDYRATVTLTASGGGTGIHWHAAFHPVWPGSGVVTALVLRRFITRVARGLAAHAATCSGC